MAPSDSSAMVQVGLRVPTPLAVKGFLIEAPIHQKWGGGGGGGINHMAVHKGLGLGENR